jgi:hypothetical protein
MESPGTVEWRQTIIGGTLQDQHFGYLQVRGGACFACISLTVDGMRWNCTLFPNGKEPGTRTFQAYASSLDRAKGWVERWTAHHWRAITAGK